MSSFQDGWEAIKTEEFVNESKPSIVGGGRGWPGPKQLEKFSLDPSSGSIYRKN
jgi:hypothetical protein